MIICDGCAVRGSWEHRCHEDHPHVGGEPVAGRCECEDCHPSVGDLAAFRAELERANIEQEAQWDHSIQAKDEPPVRPAHRPKPPARKMRLRRFLIGDPVLVHATVKTGYCDFRLAGNELVPTPERTLTEKAYDPPKQGVIVGASRVQTGTREPGGYDGGTFEEPPDYVGPLLIVDKSYPVWLVRFTMTGKMEKALNEDVEPGDPNFELPLTTTPWTDEAKAEQRKWAATMTRDKKGRFLKEGAR